MSYARPSIPANEVDRLAELRDLDVLDTDAEAGFDELTRLASAICGTPMALVSLVDADRQWFKSNVGVDAAETPREVAFCAHAINAPDELFVVPDASEDPRFKENPLVTGGPGVRFYAGMPIETKTGSAIGTLCVIDRTPRELTDAQREALKTIAHAVGAQLNLRRELCSARAVDSATGLPNGLAFENKFKIVAKDVDEGVLMLIGLDRLNRFASALGSDATNAVFRQVVQRLRAVIPAGAILASLNRGLLVLFVPNVGVLELADSAVQKIHLCLAEPYDIRVASGDEQITCAANVGVAFFPEDGATADTLMAAAEQALHSARRLDEPVRIYNSQIDQVAGQQLLLESALRKALEREELVNHYQPKIDLATGTVIGAEVLLRWKHPQRGLLPASEFVGALEASGLIIEATHEAVLRAVSDWRRWRDMGLEAPKVWVNIAAAQLRGKNLVGELQTAVATASHSASVLGIEITESALVTDPAAAARVLGALRASGIPIAIGSFGAGYSSLAHLIKLPVDELKIDRTFVSGMALDPAYLGVVNTIISLAHSLNLKVTAVGVEAHEQANLLRLLRCNHAQGFLYGGPMSADEFGALLARSSAAPHLATVNALAA